MPANLNKEIFCKEFGGKKKSTSNEGSDVSIVDTERRDAFGQLAK